MNRFSSPIPWAVLLALGLAAFSALLWHSPQQGASTAGTDVPTSWPSAVPSASAVRPERVPEKSLDGIAPPLDHLAAEAQAEIDRLEADSEAAARAALHQVGKPHADVVIERPDFVSYLEWRALQRVAGNSSQPSVTMARLVHHLLFTKQLEQWRRMADSGNLQQRSALANQLLQDLPVRVQNKEYDIGMAHQLQKELLVDVLADPQARAERLEREAQRLSAAIGSY